MIVVGVSIYLDFHVIVVVFGY